MDLYPVILDPGQESESFSWPLRGKESSSKVCREPSQLLIRRSVCNSKWRLVGTKVREEVLPTVG